MAPHPKSTRLYFIQLERGRGGRTLLLTPYWPVLGHMGIQSQVMLESVVFILGCHVPIVLVLKKKGIVLRDNWQSATITYHMRIIV